MANKKKNKSTLFTSIWKRFFFQTSDNRKSLLDEMAVTLQTKGDEANTTIAKLENDLEESDAKLKVRLVQFILKLMN